MWAFEWPWPTFQCRRVNVTAIVSLKGAIRLLKLANMQDLYDRFDVHLVFLYYRCVHLRTWPIFKDHRTAVTKMNIIIFDDQQIDYVYQKISFKRAVGCAVNVCPVHAYHILI